MKKTKHLFWAALLLLASAGCSEVADVLSALVPNNAVSIGGKTFNVTDATYGNNNGYCLGQAFFITGYTSSQEEIKVVLAEYPDTNGSYSVYSPDQNGCATSVPFVRIRLSNGSVIFSSGGGTCTLNDNSKTFTISNVKMDNGTTINGKGSYTN